MYDVDTLEGIASHLVDAQDDPSTLIDDLSAVKAQQAEYREDLRRYELKLELAEDDLNVILSEVQRLVNGDDDE
jgi:ABC-type transporter Mla subunit MlaD